MELWRATTGRWKKKDTTKEEKDLFLYLKGTVIKRENGREGRTGKGNLPSTNSSNSFPKCIQLPGLCQDKAGSLELPPDLQHGSGS